MSLRILKTRQSVGRSDDRFVNRNEKKVSHTPQALVCTSKHHFLDLGALILSLLSQLGLGFLKELRK